MFTHLTDFAYTRTTKQAIGFYLAYFLLFILMAFMAGAVLGIIIRDSANAFEAGLTLGNILAVVASFGVSLLILKKKKLLSHFGFILLCVLSGILSVFIEALGGLIPAAYLTTRSTDKKGKKA